MVKQRYLTKSRFKLAMECPTKLYYTNKQTFANQSVNDPFLEALAQGGHQIGELAKAYYPGGYDIETLDIDKALKQTNDLLQKENCIIFEAAIKYKNLFMRVDLLIKEGNNIQLIEVKAKSIAGNTSSLFKGARGGILSDWKPYVNDVAFQQYVAENAFPAFKITPYLMLVNKEASVPTSELSRKFQVKKAENGRFFVKQTEQLTTEELNEKILVAIDVTDLCREIIDLQSFPYLGEDISFAKLVNQFADHYEKDEKIVTDLAGKCKSCEFKATVLDKEAGMKSGYEHCFIEKLQWTEEDFEEDTIFDLRNFRKTDSLMEQNKIKLSDLTPADIGVEAEIPTINEKEPLKNIDRNWLLLDKSNRNDLRPYINKEKLKAKMESWTYPLHFIDFETAQAVLPLFQGAKPYEMIAFQYSHHIVYENGTVEHKSEYLNAEIGVNPNFDFVRHLKQSLEQDEGTIFRYSHHENTVLEKIYEQLEDAGDVEDKAELQQFILHITKEREEKPAGSGKRSMVDLCQLVEDYYFDPYMKGSTSIKVVLPAILNSSAFIQQKYGQPIYGAEDGVKSKNFKNMQWVEKAGDQVKDPYSLLPKLFDDMDKGEADLLEEYAEINNGGAAMVAYERLQTEEIPGAVREEMKKALKMYCELDTLAMVIIYEAWKEMVNH